MFDFRSRLRLLLLIVCFLFLVLLIDNRQSLVNVCCSYSYYYCLVVALALPASGFLAPLRGSGTSSANAEGGFVMKTGAFSATTKVVLLKESKK